MPEQYFPIRGAGKLSRAIRQTQQKHRERFPAESRGILTSRTTAGTLREPIAQPGRASARDTVPRWG